MKQLFAVLGFIVCASAANAACPATLQLKDNLNVTASAKYTDDGSGNCMVNTAEQDGANATMGTKADAAWVSGSGTVISLLKALNSNAVPAGSNTIGQVGLAATASTGATPYHLLSAASNNATVIKASAGTVYDLTIINTTTNLGDFRFYDVATTPTCSSSTNVVKNYVVQSNSTTPGLHISFPVGMKFANGVSFCFTGANADNDNTNAATGFNINIDYN